MMTLNHRPAMQCFTNYNNVPIVFNIFTVITSEVII
jgi:hypothetical protein